MDRVHFPNGRSRDALFAADNPTNPGVFSALFPDRDVVGIVEDCCNASPIIVENPDTGRHTYEGYTVFEELHSWPDGIQVILRREA